jgi:hypothetical protein
MLSMPSRYSHAIEGTLGTMRSALLIYSQDNHDYPASLIDTAITSSFPNHSIPKIVIVTTEGQPHWYSKSDRISLFNSLHDADDAGDWGYVNNPSSPDYGKVFINCTHLDLWQKPWNNH